MIADTDIVTEKVEMVLLGESGVGKTNIARRFENFEEKFEENHEPTSKLGRFIRKVSINNKEIEFQLWDTPGKKPERDYAKHFFNTAQVFILVYDVTNKDSFDKLQNSWIEWIQVIKENNKYAICK